MKFTISYAANRRRPAFGYSLLELLSSLALLLVLIAVAAPSFASFMARTELATQATTLYESLYLARSNAITRHQTIHICQLKRDTSECAENYNSRRSWSEGWLIFADNNGNNSFDANDDLIRVVRLPDNINIVFNQRGRLRFFADGSARSAGFYVCDRLQQASRHIYLLHTGRARMRNELSQRNQTICSAS